jgi:hypothetical protein
MTNHAVYNEQTTILSGNAIKHPGKERKATMKTRTTIYALAGMLTISACSLLADNNNAGSAIKAQRVQQKKERQAQIQQQKQENKEFRQSTKELKGTEKTDAIVQHRETQYQENKVFTQQQHDENMTFLKEKLATNTKLTDSQKTELTTFFESQYQENVSFRDTQHGKNITCFESVANDTTLTMDQKKAKLKEYFTQQKSETKDHIQQQKSERKAEREKIAPNK